MHEATLDADLNHVSVGLAKEYHRQNQLALLESHQSERPSLPFFFVATNKFQL